MIEFECPVCFQYLKAKSDLLGKRIRCKHCGETVRVELPVEDDSDDDELDEQEENSAGRGRSRGGRRGRKQQNSIWEEPSVRFLKTWGLPIVGACVVLGLIFASFADKQFGGWVWGTCLLAGMFCWIGSYLWCINTLSEQDPMMWLGVVLWRFGMRNIMTNRDILPEGAGKLFYVGLVFFTVGAICAFPQIQVKNR